MIITKGESCFDAAHIKLVAEVEELGESCKLLADKVVFCENCCQVSMRSVKVTLVEAARLDLMASKEKLQEDIRVKQNSIAIDQVTVTMLIFMRIVTSRPKPGYVLCT